MDENTEYARTLKRFSIFFIIQILIIGIFGIICMMVIKGDKIWICFLPVLVFFPFNLIYSIKLAKAKKGMSSEEKAIRNIQWKNAKKWIAGLVVVGVIILIPMVANLIDAKEGDRVECKMCGKNSVFSHGYCEDCFNDFIDWVDSTNNKK